MRRILIARLHGNEGISAAARCLTSVALLEKSARTAGAESYDVEITRQVCPQLAFFTHPEALVLVSRVPANLQPASTASCGLLRTRTVISGLCHIALSAAMS